MTDVDQAANVTKELESLNERIAKEAGGNWVHSNFSLATDGQIACTDSYAYRRRLLEGVFASLFVDQSVLVMDEVAGFYPALIHHARARTVAAATPSESRRELMEAVLTELSVPATILKSKVLAFYDSEPYIDGELAESYEFLLALNQVWPLYNAGGGSFDAIAEATAFLVTDGVVFDWTNAEWAQPSPPPAYSLAAFIAALRGKFAYVACISDQLLVAVGKLPSAPVEKKSEVRASMVASAPDASLSRGMHHEGRRDDEYADLAELRDDLFSRRPQWVTGSLAQESALFLAERLVESGARRVVEVGTASGFSTALLAAVLKQTASDDADYEVHSFDVSPRFYADTSHAVGDAAREMAPDIIESISFHVGAGAADILPTFGPDSISFIFLDGSHGHPWPTLDLLLSLPALTAGATVVMDDINLPLVRPEFDDWGAHYLFYGLTVSKSLSPSIRVPAADHDSRIGSQLTRRLPWMGSFKVPANKAAFRGELLEILDGHEWERDVPEAVVEVARQE